jgi:hypothetical protein
MYGKFVHGLLYGTHDENFMMTSLIDWNGHTACLDIQQDVCILRETVSSVNKHYSYYILLNHNKLEYIHISDVTMFGASFQLRSKI